MWADLQETFYLCLGPLIVGLILPVYVGVGILLAVAMAVQWLWRPIQRVVMIGRWNDSDT